MKPTQWDVARTASTMGVVTAVSIDPTRITKRVKNKLVRWLESGLLAGGCRSEARKIGQLLVEKFKAPVAMSTWRGVRLVSPSAELALRAAEIVEADWVSICLHNGSYNKPGYYRDMYLEAVDGLRNNPAEFDGTLFLHDNAFRKQIADLMSEYMDDDRRAAIQPIIDFLNGVEPIHCFDYEG